MTVSVSLLLGALLGAANALAAVWAARRATTMESNRALRFVLGGMAARLAVVLAAFAAILALVPIHRGAFVVGLGITFVAGLLAEVTLVMASTHTQADA
ncbi:MAG: ATP synthase subunit I [Bacteroidota bacterium]